MSMSTLWSATATAARLNTSTPSAVKRVEPKSARWGTALYRIKTSPQRIGEVLSAVPSGLNVAAAVRVFGHGERTITRWLMRAGQHVERVHARLFPRLHLPQVQLGEIRMRRSIRIKVALPLPA